MIIPLHSSAVRAVPSPTPGWLCPSQTAFRAILLCFLIACARAAVAQELYWKNPERSRRVLAMTPGRSVPVPDTNHFLKKKTEALLERWEKEHGSYDAAASYPRHAARQPADDLLDQHLPRVISPYARLLEGTPAAKAKAKLAMINWCPLFDVRLHDTRWVTSRPLEIRLSTGITLYSQAEAYPPDHPFRPTHTVQRPDLDGTLHPVPAVEITSPDGSRWEVYPTVCVDAIRWKEMGATAIGWLMEYQKNGDPFHVHKIAHYLDKAAEIYPHLPLSYQNEIAKRPDGKPLDRETWEALPTPTIFEQSEIGFWNRHSPSMNRGWISIRSSSGLYRNDLTWIEPFAFTRHHPAFRQYSLERYGDPDALDRKVIEKILREVARFFKNGTGHIWQALIQNYQNANYSDLYLLGALLDDPLLIDFAAPANEVTLYNHHHYDGMTAEGAPNYMAMLSHYYRNLTSPDGWPLYDPGFLQRNPFFVTASKSRGHLATVRGLPLEIGDQHLYAWPPTVSNATNPLADGPEKAKREAIGSENWPGFGIGILRAGAPGQRLESSLGYTRQVGHSKSDIMGIDLWIDGIPLIRRGGYASSGQALGFEKGSKESRALESVAWPHPPFSLKSGDGIYWFRGYASSPILQNSLLADETAPMNHRKGLPQLVRFWPGEAKAGKRPLFQALEATDRTSFGRIGIPVKEHGRALLAVEGTSGRAYLVDITKVKGRAGTRLFTGVWGTPAPQQPGSLVKEATAYPTFQAAMEDEAHALPVNHSTTALDTPYWNGGKVPTLFFEKLTSVHSHPTMPVWDQLWRVDYHRYRHGNEPAPLPEKSGEVALRLFGVNRADRPYRLHTAKGPWAARVVVPMKEHGTLNGNVGFNEAISYIVESSPATSEDTTTLFVHVMEGIASGHDGEIESVRPLPVAEADRHPETVALEIKWKTGEVDTVVYHPQGGAVRIADRLFTDARYTLVRCDAKKQVVTMEFYEGSRLAVEGAPEQIALAALEGTLVDLKGDLTGFRDQSVLIVEPKTTWQPLEKLAGLQVEVVLPATSARPVSSDFYTIEKAVALPKGRIALHLAGVPPFARGWHQASALDPKQPNVINSSRPFWLGMNNLLYHGAKAYFPRLGRTLTLLATKGNGEGKGSRISASFETDDLQKEGVQPGDWFLIHDIEPGSRVTIPLPAHRSPKDGGQRT